MAALSPALMERLRPPKVGVPGFGYVVNQSEGGTPTPYDPNAVSPVLQHTILDYFSDPNRDADGFTKWLLVVSSRQTTKTSTAVLSLANLVEYTPGSYGVLITDKRERSATVFRYAALSLKSKPEAVAYPRMPSSKDVRHITWEHGGKFQTIGANDDNPGIGLAADFLVLSELPFWNNPGDVWSQLGPAFRNRKNSMVLMESTPAPMSEPGAEWFKDMAEEAASGHSRMDYLFVPFYMSRLNERAWRPEWNLTNDEIRLLERFGPPTGHEPLSAPGANYMTLENLAFLRLLPVEDPKIKRNPELQWVWYPKDDVTCWLVVGSQAFPSHTLDRHEGTAIVEWPKGGFYVEYDPPNPDALYVIGADPSGYGTGDPASFVVIEVWADEWRVVAEYETNQHDPVEFAYHLIKAAERYNHANVFVEANGVGAGPLSTLELASRSGGLEMTTPDGRRETLHIKNIFYRKIGDLDGKPGVWSSRRTIDESMTAAVDALMDRLYIPSQELYRQLRSYRRDKEVALGETSRILDPETVGRKRRPKHHWDRVSAFLWACWGAKYHTPVRYKPAPVVERDPTQGTTLKEYLKAARESAEFRKKLERAKGTATNYTSDVRLRKSKVRHTKRR